MAPLKLLLSWTCLPAVFLLESSIKGAILLVLAAIVSFAFRRFSAAHRSMIWSMAMLGLVLLPAISLILPGWHVPPAGARTISERESRTVSPVHSEVMSPADPHPNQPIAERDETSLSLENSARFVEPSVPETRQQFERFLQVAPASLWLKLASLVWALGVTLALIRLYASWRLLKRIERESAVIDHAVDPLCVTTTSIAELLGYRKSVQILVHPDCGMPLVWGIFRSRLLLPAEARQWTDEQLRSVLFHEVAHLKRSDPLFQWISQIACACHWFNPLAWYANGRLGIERELACDDIVLAHGVLPSAYASHLLDVVSRLTPPRVAPFGGLAMSRQTSLGQRIQSVLSKNLSRRGVSKGLALCMGLTSLLITVSLSIVRGSDPVSATTEDHPDVAISGTFLPAGLESKLQWGETVKGVRAAIVRPLALGRPPSSEVFDFLVVAQNVSERPLRFTNKSTTRTHSLVVRKDGAALTAFEESAPEEFDFELAARQVAVFRIFSNRVGGASITADDPSMTYLFKISIEGSPAGSWSGTITAGELVGAFSAYGCLPQSRSAKTLFAYWNSVARRDETIPGGMIGLLADSVKTFTNNNPTWKSTPQLLEMLTRFDADRDWTGVEAIELLDRLALIEETPIDMALSVESHLTIRRGSPLPDSLRNSPFGPPAANGLRVAWLFEPRSEEPRLGTPLNSRVLVHNSGNTVIVFRARNWRQGRHTAKRSDGKELSVKSIHWLTRGILLTYRLQPGEFIELNATGIGVGPNTNSEEWQNTRVGSWIDTVPGDDVTVVTSPVEMKDWNEIVVPDQIPTWWKDLIGSRLKRTLPLPADPEERRRLLYRVAMDLFGTPFAKSIQDRFVADLNDGALERLTETLSSLPEPRVFSGSLESAPTRFHVLPPDPDAAKRPKIADGPGRYSLAENIVLAISRRPIRDRIANEASISFSTDDARSPDGVPPKKLNLADGYDSWMIGWIRGGTRIWIRDQNGIQEVDFSDPSHVRTESVEESNVPREIREALNRRAIASPNGNRLNSAAATSQ